MPLYDKPLEELVIYDPPLTAQPDFDAFWERTLAENARTPLNAEWQLLDYPVVGAHVYDVRYDGWRGARIAAWYIIPEGKGPYPALVHYHGYSGSKAEVAPYLVWALQGYAVLAVDVRGQSGESTDPGPYSSGHVRGWMTQGILDPEEYYYRGVYMDCVRALDVVSSRPEVDAERLGVMGVSQGGGLTLAVAALDQRPKVAIPEVPYLCHFQRAVEVAIRHPYLEIAEYLMKYPDREEQVWGTLSYFDNLNLARRIQCPVLMDVGLQDDICPPSSVYAVYNKIRAPKEMKVYRFHNHAAVEAHWEHKLRWVHHYLKGLPTLRS